MSEFFSDSTAGTAEKNTQEAWIQDMSEKMTPEEVLQLWEEKIGNKDFLLIFIRLLHESERKHGKMERERVPSVGGRTQKPGDPKGPQQGMTLQDILNAMSKN